MFVTVPQFEQLVPKALGHADAKYWSAMALSMEASWFLLTHRTAFEEGAELQTIAVAWESKLRLLLEEAEPTSLLALHVIEPTSQAGGWALNQIVEVWLPNQKERSSAGPLLFRKQVEGGLVDSFGRQVEEAPGRRLLMSSWRA